MAARCLTELPGGPDLAVAAAVREDLLARIANVQVHVRSRIEAGLLLGKLRDPAFPVESIGGVQVILPRMVAVDVAGAVVGSERGAPDAEGDEFPRHPVRLAPYAIGQYPVTNAEFGCFMAAGGYAEENEHLWTKGGKLWRRGEPVPGDPDPVDWYMTTLAATQAESSAKLKTRVRAGYHH